LRAPAGGVKPPPLHSGGPPPCLVFAPHLSCPFMDLALRSTRHPTVEPPERTSGTDWAVRHWGKEGKSQTGLWLTAQAHGGSRSRTRTNWGVLQQGRGNSLGTFKRSVRGAGSQGVLAAEGRIAPWDPAPRADLTTSRSSAEDPAPDGGREWNKSLCRVWPRRIIVEDRGEPFRPDVWGVPAPP